MILGQEKKLFLHKLYVWRERFKEKNYYEKHGNLLIIQRYVVNNGKEEVNLGTWINTQRMRYKGKYKSKLEQYQIEFRNMAKQDTDIKVFEIENDILDRTVNTIKDIILGGFLN